MNVVIIDYGMGNICSLLNAFRYVGIEKIDVSYHLDVLKKADKLVLPGVGSFAKAMRNIKEKNLDKYLTELVLVNKKPILGVCLGMQLMSLSSTEDGENSGLGFIEGKVTRFKEKTIKIPHVGFNQIVVNPDSKIFLGMNGLLDFYFTHSFKMDSSSNINPSYCTYGEKFIASYEVNNIIGVQFHPELSQTNGLKVIKNFIENY